MNLHLPLIKGSFWSFSFVFLAFLVISSCRPDDYPKRQFATCDTLGAELTYTSDKLACVFKLTSVTGTLESIEWDFGDGSKQTGLETTANHTYLQNNNYTVRVTLTDKCKKTALKTINITVPKLTPPSIDALAATNITDHQATLGIQLTNRGLPEATRYGICYSYLNSDPFIGGLNVSVVFFDSEAGLKSIEGLQANSTYYYRAFAISSTDTAYSVMLTFKTLHEISEGLVAHLTFDNGAWDATSNVNHGKIEGNNIPTADHRNQPNKALYFDGATFVKVPDHVSLRPSKLSISFWFKAQELPSPSNLFMQFYYKANYELDNSKQYSSSIDWNNGSIRFKADVMQNSGCNPNIQWITSPSNINLTTQWYHAVIVYANKKMLVYINGNSTPFSTWDLPNDSIDNCSGGSLNIGAQSKSLPNYFRGAMDDFRVYNIALTPDQVSALYKL